MTVHSRTIRAATSFRSASLVLLMGALWHSFAVSYPPMLLQLLAWFATEDEPRDDGWVPWALIAVAIIAGCYLAGVWCRRQRRRAKQKPA